MFNVVLNADHNLIQKVLQDVSQAAEAEVSPVLKEITELSSKESELKKQHEGKKDEEIPTAEKDELKEIDNKRTELRNKRDAIYADQAKKNDTVRQLVDLALLQNNMLKGEALNDFIKRSIKLI
ncbi:MAG: molecular chaperone HtpG, partial [Bacteroides sp.]